MRSETTIRQPSRRRGDRGTQRPPAAKLLRADLQVGLFVCPTLPSGLMLHGSMAPVEKGIPATIFLEVLSLQCVAVSVV